MAFPTSSPRDVSRRRALPNPHTQQQGQGHFSWRDSPRAALLRASDSPRTALLRAAETGEGEIEPEADTAVSRKKGHKNGVSITDDGGGQEKERGARTPSGPPLSLLEDDTFGDPLLEAWSRGKWLLGLLVLQSSSSAVLERFEDLLKDHIIVTLFLTMLVGAGGNAGNQSSIKVIRGLATGKIEPTRGAWLRVLMQQANVACLLGGGLFIGGFFRVYFFSAGDAGDAFAIAVSLLLIVMSSVVIGTSLPFALSALGADPANAGPGVQVVMDIVGVATTCVCCSLLLQ